MPAVAAFSVELCVAGFTKGDQILCGMSTSFRERQLVVDLFGGCQFSVLFAQLTQRVCFCVTVTDTLPCSAVSTAYSRVTVVLLVALGFLLGVFLTESSVGQLGTAGV